MHACIHTSAQWLELEEMRGNTEGLLRLRALASSAGVRLQERGGAPEKR